MAAKGRANSALVLTSLAADMLGRTPPAAPPGAFYRLVLIKQNSIGEEKYSKAGRSCMAKVVVKKSPFLIQFALEAISPEYADQLPDLHHFQFDARLVYEYDETKEVDFVKVAPMDWKASVTESGRQVNGEARVNVLTSQLEDMLFKIRIKAESRQKGLLATPLYLYSSPIKVVSKPDQVQKRRKKREEEAKRKAASVALASGLMPAAAAPTPALFGHPLTDDLVRSLQALERQQQAQQELLNRAFTQLAGRPLNVVLSPSELLALEALGGAPVELGDPQESVSWENSSDSSDEGLPQLRKKPRLSSTRGGNARSLPEPHPLPLPLPPPAAAPAAADAPAPQPEKLLEFEAAYSLMMGSYDNITPEQRAAKIRNVIQQQQISRDFVSEVHDLFWAEGLQGALGDEGDGITMEPLGRNASTTAAEPCTCEDCPHKKELARIENFYREVFSLY